MINLFDRIYIKHDNVLSRGEGQQKLIISPKAEGIGYVQGKFEQDQSGFVGIYNSLSDADHYLKGRDALWTMLRMKAAKVIVIGSVDVVAELLIQYWKSIFKNPTADGLYMLYEITVNYQNMHQYRPSEKRTRMFSPGTTEGSVTKLTKGAFDALFDTVEASAALEGIDYRSLPFEFLLMAYLADQKDDAVKKALFPKIDQIMRQNIVAKLAGGREELMFESHNYYLINGGEEVLITDPIEFMKNSPHLAWVVDDVLEYGNEDEVLAKYSLDQIKFFFEQIKQLAIEDDSIFVAIDCIKNKKYARLIEFDIGDHYGNFFGTGAYVNKINSLLISFMYQLKRMDNLALLEQFDLK